MDLKVYEHLVRNESATRKFLMWMIFLSALFIPAILYCIVVLAMGGMAPWERDCEHGDAGARDRREAGAARHNRGPRDNRRYPPRLDHTDGVLGVLCPLPLRSSST